MRALWSELAKRQTWRRIWVVAARALVAAGLVTPEQVDDLEAHVNEIDLERAAQIEAEIGHDLMAELKTFAEQCRIGGGILHWGMTSADVLDNADVVRQKAGLTLLLTRLRELLLQFADRMQQTAHLPILGYTHLQPAEPTTLGYRLAGFAQDLLGHFELLARRRAGLFGKGIKGAVGSGATFVQMLEGTDVSPEMMEATVMESLGIQPYPITSQTYPRIQDYLLISELAGMAATLHKFGLDLRLMQSPGFRTLQEKALDKQVGSSAMPFKRNPVKAEKLCSLARLVASDIYTAWSNAALTMLERSLDDSANRRRLIPEIFLASDEMLQTALELISGFEVDEVGIQQQFDRFGVFAATERLLTAMVQEGADRQAMHERIRIHSIKALEALQSGETNPLADLLASDTSILKFLQPAKIRMLLDLKSHLGFSEQRTIMLVEDLRTRLNRTGG
jgi:adenylosuccinate lyase